MCGKKSQFKVELQWLLRGSWGHTCNYYHKNLNFVRFFLFWKKIRYTSIHMLSIYQNRSRVLVGLVRVHGLCCCDLLAQAILASWLLPAIDFHSTPEVFAFQLMDDDISILRIAHRVYDKDKNELSVQFKVITTRTALRKFILNACAWHANEYFIVFGGNSDPPKNYFDPKRSFFADKSSWTRLPLL